MTTTFDAVVIGAGQNGMTLAGYLQRAGLKTLVVEAAGRAGGMASTTQPSLSGFCHNPHANYLLYYDLMPAVKDLHLEKFGLATLVPPAQHGIAFADGRPPVVLHRVDRLAQTHRSIARHSRRDADTFVEVMRRAATLRSGIADALYRPPRRQWFLESAARTEVAYSGLVPKQLGTGTARSVIDALFHSAELRTLLYRIVVEWGIGLDEDGTDLATLATAFPTMGRMRLPIGGMRALASALFHSCRHLGVTFAFDATVSRIEIVGGRACGVLIPHLGTIRARHVVVSTIGIVETLCCLVDSEFLDKRSQAEIVDYQCGSSNIIASSLFCLRAAPDYRSSRWDSDINRCFQTMIGLDTPGEVVRQQFSVERGLLPAPAPAIRVNTLWDPQQAPEGRHAAGADTIFPESVLTEGSPAEFAAAYNDAVITEWATYAPNISADNVLAAHMALPDRSDRKILLSHRGQYRSGIAHLYLAGTASYPGGGAHGACGFNAFGVIAADMGLSAG